MQEYKRDRINLESRLNDMTKKALHHDEHLMLIDAWFIEVATYCVYSLTAPTDRCVDVVARRSQAINWRF